MFVLVLQNEGSGNAPTPMSLVNGKKDKTNPNNSDVYKLFRLDLDVPDTNDYMKAIYKVGEPIYQYKDKQVDNQQFHKLHVRGCSKKYTRYDKN